MSIFPNSKRGEVAFEIDGKTYKLCLTLGALAALETAFATENIEQLGAKLKAISAKDLLVVLAILLEAGGNHFALEDLSKARIDAKSAALAIAQTFEAAF